MKKLTILMLICLFSLQLFAQKLPEQRQISYHDTLIYLQNHSDFQYPANIYFLGWHWSVGKFMTNALGMNIIHCGIQEYRTNYFKKNPLRKGDF